MTHTCNLSILEADKGGDHIECEASLSCIGRFYLKVRKKNPKEEEVIKNRSDTAKFLSQGMHIQKRES